jgi:tetratricopeptide repeat protein/peptidase S41-like protein
MLITIAMLALLANPLARPLPPIPMHSVVEWENDIDQLVDYLRLLHPNPFFNVGKTAFMRNVASLKKELPTLTEEQRVVRTMQLVASIGDGHTDLVPNNPNFAYWYPMRVVEFSDGYFITTAHRSVGDLAGAQLLEIGGQPIAKVASDARSLVGVENQWAAKYDLSALANARLMTGLGYTDAVGNLSVKARLRDGTIVQRVLAPRASDDTVYNEPHSSTFDWDFRSEMFGPPVGTFSDWISAYNKEPASDFRDVDISRPAFLTRRRAFVARPVGRDAYYIQSNVIGGTQSGETFIDFFRKAIGVVDSMRPKSLIIDLRFNGGGDGSQLAPVMQEIAARRKNTPWKNAYVLTSGKTFSAAIMALAGFRQNMLVTVIGEPAGAGFNSYGDVVTRELTRTGMRLQVSTIYNQVGDAFDIRSATAVDVPAEFSFADYAAGRDPAVDAIARGDDMRSIAIIAATDGGAAARRVYEARRAKFEKSAAWQPPEEIELRAVGQALLEQNRMADAVEILTLASEIHPQNWHSWYNLGNAQTAAGLKEKGLQSYRRVLELDPDNSNAKEINAALAGGGRGK